jgi:hypothetical protein
LLDYYPDREVWRVRVTHTSVDISKVVDIVRR